MKKAVSYTLALMLVFTLTICLTACGSGSSSTLKGTYTATSANLFSGPQFSSITFSDNNRVAMSAMGIIGTEGTYRIDGSTIELSYKEPSLFGEGKAVVKSMTFERSGSSIFLDGYEFVKD